MSSVEPLRGRHTQRAALGCVAPKGASTVFQKISTPRFRAGLTTFASLGPSFSAGTYRLPSGVYAGKYNGRSKAMFEDSLVESNGRLCRRNPWTTAVSFTAQGILGAGLVLLSLLYTDALPMHTLMSTVEAPPPPA